MIHTERLVLREMTLEDKNSLLKIFSDSKTMEFWERPFSKEQVERWILRNIQSYEDNGYGRWLVTLKNSNEVIGDVGFFISEIDGQIENDLGYIIYSKYWGNGYGLEAAKACLDYGFNRLRMKRIVANMAYNHYKSIKVAEKLEMKREKEFTNIKNRNILTYLYVKEGK